MELFFVQMAARAGVAFAKRVRQFGHAVSRIGARAPQIFDGATRCAQGERAVADGFADAHGFFDGRVLEVETGFARFLGDQLQERRHRDNCRRLRALDHLQNECRRRRSDPHHGAAEFAQPQRVSESRDEAAVHRDSHEHRVARADSGAFEDKPLVQCCSRCTIRRR